MVQGDECRGGMSQQKVGHCFSGSRKVSEKEIVYLVLKDSVSTSQAGKPYRSGQNHMDRGWVGV